MVSPGSVEAVDPSGELSAEGTSDSAPEHVPGELSGRSPRSLPDVIGSSIFAVGAIFTVGWLLILGRGLTFFFDEWDFVDTRNQSFWSVDLTPHNGHPVVVPFAIYRLALQLVGLKHYWPYMLLAAAANILCGWLLFVLLRRKLHPVIAASAACVLMLLGPAWQDLLWPFQIGFFGSMAGGLAALVLLDRSRPGSNVGASACLLVAVFSSGIGLTMVAGIIVELLWRRHDWRRLWIPLVPAAAFGVWFLARARGSSSLAAPTAGAGARFIGQSAAGAAAALVGRGTTVGGVLAVVLGVLILIALIRQTSRCGRLAMAVVGGLSFWMLTLLTRGSDPTASRYLYPGAVFLLLAVGELPTLLSGNRNSPGQEQAAPTRARWITAVALPVIVLAYAVLATVWNSAVMRAGRGGLAGVSQTVRAELSAVQLEARALQPSFRPDTVDMPQVTAGAYVSAVGAYGSPALPSSQLVHQPVAVRTSVDAMLLRGIPLDLTAVSETSVPDSPCTLIRSATGWHVNLPSSGIWVSAPPGSPVSVFARSYSPIFLPVAGGVIPAGSSVHIGWNGERTTVAWQLLLRVRNDQAGAPACAQ